MTIQALRTFLRSFFLRHRRIIIETLLIVAVALVPRLIGVGLFLTADEKNWVGRSYEFIKAVKEFRFNDTLQTTHPGVTTLWLAGVTIAAATKIFGMPFTFGELQRFVMAAQIPIAIVNAVLVGALFLLLRSLVSARVARIAALVIALDPFLIGYSKVVHVDALLTGFLACAVLLWIIAVRQWQGKALVVSAVAAALAILTKIPAMIIFPFALLTLFGERNAWKKAEWGERTRFFLQWIILIGLLILIIWPALVWVPDPRGNIHLVQRDITTAFVTPHHMEESYTLNAWQYPGTILARTTIPVLAGLTFAVGFALTRRGRRALTAEIPSRVLWSMVLFVGLFIILMTVTAKKGDRYLLPIFPFLDIVGVVGLLAAAQMMGRRVLRGTLIAAFAILLFTLVRLGPYALAYYNPLFPPNFSQELGWGEGLDQVAEFLDEQPGNDIVASWYPQELGALTGKRVSHINAHEQVPVGYVVLYRNMFGRAPDHWANDFIDEYYKKRDPAFTAVVNGLPYAWVYRKPVYSAVLGQLTPGRTIVTEFQAHGNGLSRVDLLTVTYGGKAKSGSLTLRLRERPGGPDVRTVTVPVSAIENNAFTEFSFDPISDSKGKTYLALISADGTSLGNAPSVRAAPAEKDHTYVILDGPVADAEAARKRIGEVGITWYFRIGSREVSREEVE